ncbi:hypothetical protein ACIQV3_23375 [Streptomyces sp. NPDC099050]|uniref:hypothetical protein n=1 Tax=Streptomyces sp. NPDC099050 TaxID=3366100 RepID=UPI003802A921
MTESVGGRPALYLLSPNTFCDDSRGLATRLGPLVGFQGVLDAEGVQVELLGDDQQLGLGRSVQVDPRHAPFRLAELADARMPAARTPAAVSRAGPWANGGLCGASWCR